MNLLFLLLGTGIGAIVVHALLTRNKQKEVRDILARTRFESDRRAYQSEVVRELGERMGYSLDVNKIIEIITGSLDKLLDYHTISYMVRGKDRIVFKCILRESVNRAFVAEVAEKMLAAFSAMVDEKLDKNDIDESITGTIFDESRKDQVGSFFNLPLVISGGVVGLITVASPKRGLYNEEDTAILYSITDQAATAVTKLQQLLASEQRKLNTLVTSLTDGILMVDEAWNLLVINPRARQLLDLPQGTVTMLDILDKLSGKIDLRTKIEEAEKKNTIVSISDVTVGPITMQLTASPVRDKDTKAIGGIIVFHDVTQEKALERLREEFTAMMIHELRSPLNNVRISVDTILRNPGAATGDQMTGAMSIIRNETVDMLNLVNDLLDMAKIETGKFTVTKTPTNLEELIIDEVKRLDPRAAEKKLVLRFEPSGDLTGVPLDAFRIRQVLTNLLTNGIKFTETGGITIQAKRVDHEINVSVADTGIGMTHEGLAGLFTKFHQLHSTAAPEQQGTGLGLVIARGIVEAHGGKIWAESEVGVGTTFTFTIPV